jgi:hypothetical protein
MRILVVSVLALSACGGGSSPEWAGKWRQPTGIPVGSYMEATLGGSGHTITGTGVQHREAGTDLTFTVLGTADPIPGPGGFTVTYSDNTTEGFSFAQPDANHITLQNPQRTVNLVRQ